MTNTITVRTNHQPRDILFWHDLSAKEQAEFDWLETETQQSDAQFFRYRGNVYCLGEFMGLHTTGTPEFKEWDGYHADSYFSGILVRYVEQFERVIVATFMQ